MEDPTYFIALGLLQGDLGLKVVPIPMDKEGIDVRQLQLAVEREKLEVEEGRSWAMVYTIPNYHNPTGITMSRERARALLQLATQHDLLVFCDDVYNLLSYQEKAADSFSRLRAVEEAEQSCVISNGSLSKVLAPGVRLGWIEASPAIISRLSQSGVLQSGGSLNNLTSGLVTSLLSLGLLDTWLLHCRDQYRERMAAALAQLQHLPQGWQVGEPGGGYFLWVTGPKDLTAFCSHLKAEAGVAVLAGPRASSSHYVSPVTSGPRAQAHAFRLSVAFYTVERIEAACREIVRLAASQDV